MGRRVKMMLGAAFDGWRPGVREGGVYYDGDPDTTERALVVTGATAPGEGRDLGREKRVLVGLEHPNVLRMLSLALAAGRPEPVFAYAFTHSVSLARLMRALRAERGLLPWGVVVAVVEAVAAGAGAVVRAAHDYRGFAVFHPGPTPDDLLLDDAGTARACGFELWREGSHVRSSPGYGCPMGTLGESGLVYGLGALLVEMLSGERPPTAGRSVDRHLEVVRRVQIKVLARPGDRLPQNLVDLVAACLSHAPEDRPSLDDLVLELGELAERAPEPHLGPWASRVVVALRAGETLTESVMAADPRFGMSPPAAHGEDLDPDFRPTTIDPERAAAVAQLQIEDPDELAPDMDSLHGVLASPIGGGAAWRPEPRPEAHDPHGPRVPQPWDRGTGRRPPSPQVDDPSVPRPFEPESGSVLTEPVQARPPLARSRAESRASPPPSRPSRPATPPRDPSPTPTPAAPESGSRRSAPAPHPPVAPPVSRPAEPVAPPPAPPAQTPSRLPTLLGAVGLVVVAVAAGWFARGLGPAPGDEAPSVPVREVPVEAPATVAPPTPPPAPPAAAPPEAAEPAEPAAPSVPAAEPTPAPPPRRPAPAPTPVEVPAAPDPPPVEPSAAPEAPAAPTVFEVVFRSADPTVTDLEVKCHQGAGSGSGTATVTVSEAGPGPCRVTGRRGAAAVEAVVSVNGPRTFTCFGGGSRGCR